jgi:HlyD family secretion protein
MANTVFRKVSLDRIASPEELDQLITVTGPRAWLVLAALLSILGTAVLWGFLGNIPQKVEGRGILMASGGVLNIVNSAAGRITDVRVKSGDRVRKGTIVARIDQPELTRQINDCKRDLEAVKSFSVTQDPENRTHFSASLDDLYQLARQIKQEQAAEENREKEFGFDLEKKEMELKQSTASLNEAKIRRMQAQTDVRIARENVARLQRLSASGISSRAELEEARNKLLTVETQVNIAEQDVKTAEINAKVATQQVVRLREKRPAPGERGAPPTEGQLKLRMLQSQLADKQVTKMIELEKQIKELMLQSETNGAVVAPVDGRVLEVRVKKRDLVGSGTSLMSLVKEGQFVNNLEVVLYVAAEEGKKIAPGMEAQIAPTIVKREDYGFMRGKVTWVAEYPATGQNMLQTLGSEELVSKMAENGAPIEVRVDLVPDPDSFSGFKWSTVKGAPVKVDSGNLCDGTIIVMQQRPIEMVIPYIKKRLNFD